MRHLPNAKSSKDFLKRNLQVFEIKEHLLTTSKSSPIPPEDWLIPNNTYNCYLFKDRNIFNCNIRSKAPLTYWIQKVQPCGLIYETMRKKRSYLKFLFTKFYKL
jgi:hypothetical protein